MTREESNVRYTLRSDDLTDLMKRRILQRVEGWAEERQIYLSPAKKSEVAALVAESEANGADGVSALRLEQYAARIQKLRYLGESFRIDADNMRKTERAL